MAAPADQAIGYLDEVVMNLNGLVTVLSGIVRT